MEHKKYNQVPFDLDIIDIIEQKVKSLAEKAVEDKKNDGQTTRFASL